MRVWRLNIVINGCTVAWSGDAVNEDDITYRNFALTNPESWEEVSTGEIPAVMEYQKKTIKKYIRKPR